MTVRREDKRVQLSIFVGSSDTWHGKPLAMAILEKARQQGLGGASVWHGQAGFGSHSRVHTASLVDLAHDLPVKVEIVDAEERIQAFLPVLDEMVAEGLVTMSECTTVRYTRDWGAERKDR